MRPVKTGAYALTRAWMVQVGGSALGQAAGHAAHQDLHALQVNSRLFRPTCAALSTLRPTYKAQNS